MGDRNNLTVAGGGVLGGQIAWHSAYSGKNVVVYDVSEEGLNGCRSAHSSYAQIYQDEVGASADSVQATQARVSYTTDMSSAFADAQIVIEAIPEVPDIKLEFYSQVSQHLPADTIIATNSSTLLPSTFAQATGRPDKFCALHFANMIWHVNLAEVMAHPSTSEETLAEITRFAIEIGMVPIPLRKEQNGYVINSLLIPVLQAAQSLVTNGVSDPETVDRTWMIMHGGVQNGPFGTIDIIGMRTTYNVLDYWGKENGDDQMLANAAYIKEHFVDKGLLGLQTGQGYYSYPDPAYNKAGFLDVPDISSAHEISSIAVPK
jgi:3-hydroxybutyryl-CoA dehydrogenase